MSDSGKPSVVPINQDDGLRRQGSYLSITSGQSVYLTANASSADDDEFEDFSSRGSLNSESAGHVTSSDDGEDQIDFPKQQHQQLQKPSDPNKSDGRGSSNSGIGGTRKYPSRKSLTDGSTTSTLEDECDDEVAGLVDMQISDKSTASGNHEDDEESSFLPEDEQNEIGAGGISNTEDLIQENVSRLCNEIAEALQPDFQKQAEIERASFEDVRLLRTLAVSEGGLLSNPLRKRAWPVLLGIPLLQVEDKQNEQVPRHHPHVDEKIKELVQLDVNRVLKRFPPHLSEVQQDHIQSYLSNLVLAVLEANPQAHYYQGFHDISLTFLLVCLAQNVPYIAYMSLNQLVKTSLAPFMEKTMDATHDIIYVIYALIEMENKALYNKIVVESKCPAAFCLAWVITWFSHTLPNDTDIFRLADFILGCHNVENPSSLVPVFLSAALVLRNAEDIINNVTDTDIASMHYALAQLPVRQTSLEPWLKDSLELINKYGHHEKALILRAIKIKQLQHHLWNEEPSRRRPVPRSTNRLAAVGRFFFIRHRWVTVAVLVLLAAYTTQRGFGVHVSPYFSPIRSFFFRTFQRRQD